MMHDDVFVTRDETSLKAIKSPQDVWITLLADRCSPVMDGYLPPSIQEEEIYVQRHNEVQSAQRIQYSRRMVLVHRAA